MRVCVCVVCVRACVYVCVCVCARACGYMWREKKRERRLGWIDCVKRHLGELGEDGERENRQGEWNGDN